MNPKVAAYHFLVGSHPVDLFRLGLLAAAEQRLAGRVARPLVVATFGGASVAAACGWSLPGDYVGLAGCAGKAGASLDSAMLSVPYAGAEVSVLLPPTADLPAAESLDRAREPLAERVHDLVFVTVAHRRLGTDLPPLEPTDEVSCFWEIGDLHPRHEDSNPPPGFGDVAERLTCQPARFHGIHLYSRTARRRERLSAWAETIHQSAGGRLVNRQVLVLEEHDHPSPILA